MKQFNQHTDLELLALTNDEVNDAIKIEAINRGVEPPIPISEAVRKSEWRGYQKPQESMEVYEIVVNSQHGSPITTGVGYLSMEAAEKALIGVCHIEEDRYGKDQGWKIRSSIAHIMVRQVGTSKAEQAWAKLEEYREDNVKFNEVVDECIARLSKVRQDDYNRRVNKERKQEYLRLAGGDEEVAKGFWAKVVGSEWPID